MDSQSYPFTVGSLECMAVADGSFAYPTASFFPDAPEHLLADELGGAGGVPERVVSSYTCLAVRSGGGWVLIDTGGAGIAPTTGRLRANLEAAGVAPGEVGTVVLTHAHPDHIGGVTDHDGRPVFPAARWFMSRDEWDFWTDPDVLASIPTHVPEVSRQRQARTAGEKLPAIRESVTLVDGEEEVAPGIRLVPAPGHTPGHAIVRIASSGESLLYLSDTALHPLHLAYLEWRSQYDMDQERAAETRRQVLTRATAERALVFAFHFPYPGLGHVVRQGKGWKWQPI